MKAKYSAARTLTNVAIARTRSGQASPVASTPPIEPARTAELVPILTYSSTTKSNTTKQRTQKMTSNAPSSPSQRRRSPDGSPANTRDVASTAAMTTGTLIGKTSSGSMTSRARVFTAIAEKSVPTAAKPNVPSNAITATSNDTTPKLKNAVNTGRQIASTRTINRKLPSSFAR